MGYIMDLRKKVGHDELIGVGGGIFIVKEGRVLLQRRADNSLWSMHSGAMEIGETLEENARRELFEETGLRAGELELLGIFSGEDMRHTYPNGDKVCIVQVMYIAREYEGEIKLQKEELSELRWFDIGALPDDINPPDNQAFRALEKWFEKNR